MYRQGKRIHPASIACPRVPGTSSLSVRVSSRVRLRKTKCGHQPRKFTDFEAIVWLRPIRTSLQFLQRLSQSVDYCVMVSRRKSRRAGLRDQWAENADGTHCCWYSSSLPDECCDSPRNSAKSSSEKSPPASSGSGDSALTA